MRNVLWVRLAMAGVFVVAAGFLSADRRAGAEDVLCYDQIRPVACPTVPPGPTCQTQMENNYKNSTDKAKGEQGPTYCTTVKYVYLQEGPWGMNGTTPCYSIAPTTTGTKCVLSKEEDGSATPVTCGSYRKCKFVADLNLSPYGGTCQTDDVIVGDPFYTNQYTLERKGCKTRP